MSTSTPPVEPVDATSEVLDYRGYAAFEEIYTRELALLATFGIADPEVTWTGGNCYALTGALTAADGRSIYLLATTNGEPALTIDEPVTHWTVGLYDTESDSVALAMGEASVTALIDEYGEEIVDSSDALGSALTGARMALDQYAAPSGKIVLIGNRGVSWITE
ncbi:hypothetical protein [Rhodococcus koreensis]|uniref:Uncharacterized protein n=1 Tax=Rhodococcus koreensis TaxID=99653 RepID=A0A1H4I5W5_9NOCA|nr:hypothetical protein [Rhodococcus koreensis]SEB29467.1 hypothetical protein SAMN04490239_0095 [Rhodococcus koreensis]